MQKLFVAVIIAQFAVRSLGQNLPDLVPIDVGWTAEPVPGQLLSVNITVTNVGTTAATAPAGVWVDEWVLSTNNTTGGIIASNSTAGVHGDLLPNQGYTLKSTLRIPPVPPGQYFLIGIADSQNKVLESNETNNTIVKPISISMSDLMPASVGWTGDAIAGLALTLNMTVTNAGSGTAYGNQGVWTEAWILSSNMTAAGAVSGGVFTSDASHAPVPPGGTYSPSLTITLPNVPAGQYFLIGIADFNNNVLESNEANNAKAVPIPIDAPDLAVSNLSFNGTPTAGFSLPVSFIVSNVGTNDYSGAWYDSLTLSTNTSISGAISTWDWWGTHSLSPGSNYVQNRTITLPPVPPGTNYFLIAKADDTGQVFEQNKTNNAQAINLTITYLPPVATLLSPTSITSITNCAPLAVLLSANVRPQSYAVTNVEFLDGATSIGNSTSLFYRISPALLDHGNHSITALAADEFGFLATSQVATISVRWPNQTNLLRADLFGNDCVVCMSALAGSNYLVQSTTNLSSPANWQPLVTITNLLDGYILVTTNHRTFPVQLYRTHLLP